MGPNQGAAVIPAAAPNSDAPPGTLNHQSSPDPLKWFVAVQSPGFHLTLSAFRLLAVLLLPCCCAFILVQNPFLPFFFFFCLLPQNYGTSRAVQLRSVLQIAWRDLWIGLCHQSGCTLDPWTIMQDNLGLSCSPSIKGKDKCSDKHHAKYSRFKTSLYQPQFHFNLHFHRGT